MSARPAASSPAGSALPVSAHSAHPQHKFASMMSPVKVHTNPMQGLQPASASGGFSAQTQSSSSHGSVGLAVAPPSGASSGGRYTTMLPSELRQPIPASEAPDARPDAARVYAGMATPSKAAPAVSREGARKAFWAEKLAGAPVVPHPKKIDTSDLPKRLLSELDMELEAGHFSNFSPELSAADFDSIRRVLACELELSERESYMVGSAHLAARLFVACDKDEAKTLALFVLLESKLRSYTASGSSSPLRNDVLLLNDLLQAHPAGAELVSHFSSPDLSFDLVDLGDVIATWFAGCFAALFPPEFALRAVDLVLLSKDAEGAQACVAGLMLGVLLVSAMQLLGCPNSESLFCALHDLPGNITKAQMNEAFAYAYWCFEVPRAKGTLALTRKQADWAKLIAQAPGTIKFSGNSSTPAAAAAGAASSTANSSAASSRSTSTTSSAASSAAASPAVQYRGITVGAGKQQPSGSSSAAAGAGAAAGFSLSEFHQEAASARHSIAMKEGASLLPCNSNAAATNGSSAGGNASATNKGSNQSSSSAAAASSASAQGTSAAAASITPTKASSAATASSAASTAPAQAASSSSSSSSGPSSPRHAPNTSAAGHLDPQLVTELSAATAQGVRVTSGNTQQLLERALREIKRLEAVAAGAATETDPAAAARALAGTVSAIAPTSATASASTASSLQKFRATPASGLIRYSDLLEYQSFPSLCMQGYLNKSRAPSKLFQRKGSTGFFGNLHRRFFVLQGSFLTYFKSHHEQKPTRDESLDLRTCVASKLKNHQFAPFAMSITVRDKGTLLYLLFADNETVRDVWLECLANATQLKVITS